MVGEVTLEDAVEAFARWRLERRNQGPIPMELMRMAASSAEQFGVAKVAKKLGLNGGKLSLQIELLSKARTKPQPGKVPATHEVASDALQFSRVEPFFPFSEAQPAKEIQIQKSRIHAELTLKNGTVITLFTSSSVRMFAQQILLNGGC